MWVVSEHWGVLFAFWKASQSVSQGRLLTFDKKEQWQTSQKSFNHESQYTPIHSLEASRFWGGVKWHWCPRRPFLWKSFEEEVRSIAGQPESRAHSHGTMLKGKLKGKCEWNRWFAMWLAWPNPTEVPGQPDSKQISYYSQSQRCGWIFRHSTIREMKEEVLVDWKKKKKDFILMQGC